MPDCSAVTVTAYLPEELRPQAAAIMAELGDITNDNGWDWRPVSTGFDGEATVGEDNAYIQWSDYDCPWGTTTPDDAGLFKILRERGIAYQAVDYGHYTWDGSTEVWKPGMDKPMVIESGTEGSYMISVQAIYALVSKLQRRGVHGLTDDAAFRAGVFAMIPPELP